MPARRLVALPLAAALCTQLACAATIVNARAERALPVTAGALRIAGLHAPVTVLRDATGIPHIRAGDAHDLFFAQGYVTAQDRFFQMELARRMVAGRLAEVLGPDAVESDRVYRTLGYARDAARLVQTLDADVRDDLVAYCAGVNAFLHSADETLPVEVGLLDYEPEAFTPADAAGILLLLGDSLALNLKEELAFLHLRAYDDAATARALLPAYPARGDTPILAAAPVDRRALATLLPALRPGFAGPRPARGVAASNNWALGGSRTAGGRPIVCGDPHLPVQMPGIWYAVHLTGGAYDVAGLSVPGVPYVAMGHNRDVAWTMTALMQDALDVVVLEADPAATAVRTLRGWAPIVVRKERVAVAGAPPVDLTVRDTRYGPVINDLYPTPRPMLLALRWAGRTALTDAAAFRGLNGARSVDDALAATRRFHCLGLNLVCADRTGAIGYQAGGAVPARARPTGQFPVAATDVLAAWAGMVDPASLPSAVNPPDDLLVTANNRPTSAPIADAISRSYAPPYRARRIRERLLAQATWTPEQLEDVQHDVYSEFGTNLVRCMRQVPPRMGARRVPQRLLLEWDGRMTTDSVGATLAMTTLAALWFHAFADEAGPAYDALLDSVEFDYHALHALLEAGAASPFWDDVMTPDRTETMVDVLELAFDDAVTYCTNVLGPDPATWTWGRLHTLTYAHPLGAVPQLAPVFNRGPYPMPGGCDTVQNGTFLWPAPYATEEYASYRLIMDTADWDAMRLQGPSGQSGNPASSHYDDAIPDYLAQPGAYATLPFTPGAVDAAAVDTLTLVPAE